MIIEINCKCLECHKAKKQLIDHMENNLYLGDYEIKEKPKKFLEGFDKNAE